MFPSLPLFSRTTYRGAAGSGAGRSGRTGFRSSPDSRKSNIPIDGLWMKRSQRGLYHGVTVQSGNNVPHSRHKTKRTWAPNIQRRDVFSDVLGRKLQISASTKALRTIRKKGGLDAYLCDTKDHQLGVFGQQLRDQLAALAASRASDSNKQQAQAGAKHVQRAQAKKTAAERMEAKTGKKLVKPDVSHLPTFSSTAHKKAHNKVSSILTLSQGGRKQGDKRRANV